VPRSLRATWGAQRPRDARRQRSYQQEPALAQRWPWGARLVASHGALDRDGQLLWQAALYVLHLPPQHERLQDLVQPARARRTKLLCWRVRLRLRESCACETCGAAAYDLRGALRQESGQQPAGGRPASSCVRQSSAATDASQSQLTPQASQYTARDDKAVWLAILKHQCRRSVGSKLGSGITFVDYGTQNCVKVSQVRTALLVENLQGIMRERLMTLLATRVESTSRACNSSKLEVRSSLKLLAKS
jgi:hypothetical protein